MKKIRMGYAQRRARVDFKLASRAFFRTPSASNYRELMRLAMRVQHTKWEDDMIQATRKLLNSEKKKEV